MIKYKDQVDHIPLTRFMQETSMESFNHLVNTGKLEGQAKQLLNTYINNPNGLTDFQASKILNLDCSTISARRNTLKQKLGTHAVVNIGRSSNGKGRRSGLLWVINKHAFLEE